jgi:ABC-type polysaccharide/polyol phosphate export permease
MSGSATTILAVVILFICVIVTFEKFAIFVISTIVFSVFYSLCFFCSVLLVCGPQGKFGDIGTMFTTCVDWIKF